MAKKWSFLLFQSAIPMQNEQIIEKSDSFCQVPDGYRKKTEVEN